MTLATRLKHRVAETVHTHRDTLIAFGEDIFDHAELGFREERTADAVAAALTELGLQCERGLGLTGVKARLKGHKLGPTVAILGELDGLPMPSHPRSNRQTGAAHACGHNAQLTHLIGVAHALIEANAHHDLAGDVVFFAVPAEEYVDLEWRLTQVQAGKIQFLGGKSELLRIGAFDDVDMAMLIHASGLPADRHLSLRPSANGLVAKRARFIGRAAHAAAPHMGVNALNAANLAMQAIHVQRETFRDEDRVRVQPILSHGGESVNIVPANVLLEAVVRAATYAAIGDAEKKVDRALRAGALAVGCGVEITTLPGYLPLIVDPELAAVFKPNAIAAVGESNWAELGPVEASTDAGDLSHVLPVLHPGHGGCSGMNHAPNFAIADPETAYIAPTVALTWTILDLLGDDARRGRAVVDGFQPRLTRAQYLDHMRHLTRHEVDNYT